MAFETVRLTDLAGAGATSVVDHPEQLLEEARRCERISLGIGDPVLARQLLEWAEDYRTRSAALATVLGDLLAADADPNVSDDAAPAIRAA